jgi:hypothetical protein
MTRFSNIFALEVGGAIAGMRLALDHKLFLTLIDRMVDNWLPL